MDKYPQSIYIHIPFCKTKCPYCDFASWAKKEDLIDQYFDALTLEIKSKCEAYFNYNKINSPQLINTIFIGGGTPSLINPTYYDKLFTTLKRYFSFDKNCEITLELNPGTAKEDFLIGYKNIGINRISIGAQSFNEDALNTLGRKHSIEETIYAINCVKKANIDNFSLDLIFSVPNLSIDEWRKSIEKAISFNPKHISAYSLIIEPNTPFENIYKDKSKLPTDDHAFEMYKTLCSTLKSNKFTHYEISNFAKPGYESRHNLAYWSSDEYFAFGNNAHKFINKLRTNNLRELEDYIKYPCRETISDIPSSDEFEKLMLSSRLSAGIDIPMIEKCSNRSKSQLSSIINDLSDEGYITIINDKLIPTEKGMFLNNELLIKLT